MMLTRWTKKQRAVDAEMRRLKRLPAGLSNLTELIDATVKGIREMVVSIPELKQKMQDLPGTNFELAEKHFANRDYTDAAMRYKMVLKWQPDNVTAIYKLGRAIHLAGKGDRAGTCYKETLRLQPDHVEARYMDALVTGVSNGIERCPPSIIREQFDMLAPMFENWYTQSIEYQGHSMMANSLKRWFEETYGEDQSAEGRFDIIELGCGTGLTGRKLRYIARRMTGVDLSPEMMSHIPKPKEEDGKPLYDEEILREAVDYLSRATKQSADMIIASAVWNYNGDLSPLLKQAHPVLREDGVLAFSLERMPSTEDKGFVMIPQVGRFQHSESYVRTQLASHHYELISLENFQLYKTAPGMMILAKKSS